MKKLVCRNRYECTGSGKKRWGKNPGSVFVGDQKLKINVPRVRDVGAGQEVPLQSYERLQNPSHLDEVALSRVINGISQGRYVLRAAEHVLETFGIKKSSISRKFIRSRRSGHLHRRRQRNLQRYSRSDGRKGGDRPLPVA